MGSLDPLAAFALQAVASAQAAVDEAILNLGTLVDDLKAQVSVGDVVSATVLPPENGVDRLQILNQTVAAQLPPGIFPGQTVALQVTGFTASAVLVRNLGVTDDAPPSSESTSAPAPASTPSQPAASAQPPRAPSPSDVPPVAPPREIFVAASVRQNPQAAQNVGHVPSASTPPSAAELEARIAANRATTPSASPVPASSSATPRTTSPSIAAASPSPPQPSTPAPSASAPLKPGDVAIAVARAAVERSVSRLLTPKATVDALPLQQPPAGVPRPAPEASLLARLQVPISATTLAAARIIDSATESVTRAFERLDALLEKLPDVQTLGPLRSSLPFVARFDLRNTATLPEQIASYVSNVVNGAESKIAQIVRALSAQTSNALVALETGDVAPESTTASLPPGNATLSSPVTNSSAQLPTPLPTSVASPSVIAHAAERVVALTHDIKTALLALTSNAPSTASPQLITAIRDALTATTAVQLNALQAQNSEPNVITIALPAYYHEGGSPAKLRISKEAPNGKNALDADNFHIAFVLDTAALGTVAIDLQTVGRSVSVDVKTETPRAAERFRSTLDDLRGKLHDMHYKVSSAVAAVAPRPAQSVPDHVTPSARAGDSNVDAHV